MTDNWSGFADLLASLIEKYAAVLDIDNLPESPIGLESCQKENISNSKLSVDNIETDNIA